ncbi:MAG: methylmalonyl Co-A mutase-associated GTPase MeaB [Clostridia bacterium]|nr:methylmalonyl Co-A mutase-associated GTPase MeaB [Clostridia bacterium]
MELVERLLQGDRRALARCITLVENRAPESREILRQVFTHTGRAHVVGFTGAPGAGKSTLVYAVARHHRRAGRTVAVVAVDPSSPFSGGALLGDRVRMHEAGAVDEGLFVRSLATRGHLGGLSRAAADVIACMDAAGWDVILVETVGAGQSEVEVMRHVHTTVVVAVPGLGDEVQAIKAGILEIADVFVVNKADREGAERVVADLRLMLDLNPEKPAWRPPIVKTVATSGEGVAELCAKLDEHRSYLESSGAMAARLRQQARERLREALVERLLTSVLERPGAVERFEELAEAVARRQADPYTAAASLLDLAAPSPR